MANIQSAVLTLSTDFLLLLSSPCCPPFRYKLLDRHVFPGEPTSNRAVLVKTALDQLVWGPIMLVVFIGEAPHGCPACRATPAARQTKKTAFSMPPCPPLPPCAHPGLLCSLSEDAGGAPRAHPVHPAADVLAYHAGQLLPVSRPPPLS